MKRMVPSRQNQQKELKRCLKKYHKHTTIIFCNTKHTAENVAEILKEQYPGDVMAYHSGKKSEEKAMLSGKKHIVVATSALSMGVDVKDVDLVIHYNMPMSLADYYQMYGRAGRERQKAQSVLLYNADDYYTGMALISEIEDKSAKKRAKHRLDKMKEFCEDTKHCMVQAMLCVLSDLTIGKCRYCTNCQRGK